MPAVQHQFAFARPLQAQARTVRRPFQPSQGEGPYRLPHEVRDRLALALAPFRNREAAFVLATFIARFWSVPGRVAGSFPIDRRALAGHEGLELTEARVRGAIRVLEEVGFLDRATPLSGSKYKATEDGLHRKPILYVFGPEYAPAFIKANKRAQAARGSHSPARRPITPSNAPRQPVTLLVDRLTNSPKSKSEADKTVFMGDLAKGSSLPPSASESDPKLEAALERLFQGYRHSRGG